MLIHNPRDKSLRNWLKYERFYAIKHSLSQKVYYLLCLFSCFLVALVFLTSNALVSQGAIIFLNLAQHNKGEKDFVIYPRELKIISKANDELRHFYSSLNYTQFILNSEHRNSDQLSSPRIERWGTLRGCSNCTSKWGFINIFDFDKEKSMQLGRMYSENPDNVIESNNECVIFKATLEALELEIDDSVEVIFNIQNILKNIILSNYHLLGHNRITENIGRLEPNSYLYDITLKCSVINTVDNATGKKSTNNDDFIFLELSHFGKNIYSYLHPELIALIPDFPALMKEVNIYDYVDRIIVNLPADRMEPYFNLDLEDLKKYSVSYLNKFNIDSENFGVDTLLSEIEPLYYGTIFLGLILNIIIIFLFLLAVFLIYSLIQVTTETSTLELGLLRLIGSTRKSVVIVVLLQCMLFSIPAFVFAYLAHFGVLSLYSRLLSSMLETTVTLESKLKYVIQSLLITIMAPLTAAIIPLRSLLRKSLADSINTTLSKTSGLKIEIVSIMDRERQTLIAFGILSCLYGMSIYYFLPYSLISGKLTVLMLIFICILIGMVLGLVIFTSSIDLTLQKIVTKILFMFSKSYYSTIILKNLTSHRLSNKSTSIMFSVSVGLFILVINGIRIEYIADNMHLSRRLSSDLRINAGGDLFATPRYIYPTIKELIEKNLISGYTMVVPNFESKSGSVFVKNIGKAFELKSDLYAMTPPFFDNTDKRFLEVNESAMPISISLADQLYSSFNKGRAIVSLLLKDEFNLHVKEDFLISIKSSGEYMSMVMQPSLIMSSSAYFDFEGSFSFGIRRDIAITIPMYADLLAKSFNLFHINNEYSSMAFNNFPINVVFFKLTKEKSDQNVDEVWEIVRANNKIRFDRDYGYKWVLDRNERYLYSLFYVLSGIVLFFCFFNLNTTMIINISNQTREMAIYRSVGITSRVLQFIYISETFVMIISAQLAGVFIGTAVSWTMLIQRVLFQNLPLKFAFPYKEVGIIFVLSLIGSFLTTVFTIRHYSKKEISNLFRE